jgi:hypothetical protein
MARIKIKDLPKDIRVSREEMRRVLGGTTFRTSAKEKSIILKSQPGPTPPESGVSIADHGYTTSEDGYVLVW